MPSGGVPSTHRWLVDLQAKALRAEVFGSLLDQYLQSNQSPDLVIGHSGWGELLPVRALLPQTPIWHQVEFTYWHQGADIGFDPEFSDPVIQRNDSVRLVLSRSFQLLSLDE